MKNANKKFTDTDIRVNCRLSYAHLFKPRSMDGGEPKYQATLLIKKQDKEAVALVRGAEEAAKKLFAERFGKAGKLSSTVYDGDEDFPNDANCEGMLVVRASSKTQPGLKVLDGGILCDALSEEDLYSGCYAAVEINFFPYNNASKKGVSAGLNNVLKLEDGERLGGSSRSADDAFDDLC